MRNFNGLDLFIETTPQVLEEIRDSGQLLIMNSLIDSGLLRVDTNGNIKDIVALLGKFRGLSFTDCSVIELAVRRQGNILSSDGGIRKCASKMKIPVKGVLWVIEEMVIKNIITLEEALSKLTIYPSLNDRAPLKEIASLVKKFSSSTVTNI